MYRGRSVLGFKETLRAGYWPAGSVWQVRDKVIKIVGEFENQTAVETA
jgi:hypothetical protein